MGLFDAPELCLICGDEAYRYGHVQISGGRICRDCRALCSPLITSINLKTPEQIRDHIVKRAENTEALEYFHPTDEVGKHMQVDKNTQTWCCPSLYEVGTRPDLFMFSEIIDFELIENGISVSKGGLGSALVGGLLFGGAGAVVGGVLGRKQHNTVNSMSVVINLTHEYINRIEIRLLSSEVARNSFLYNACKSAGEQIISLLSYMVSQAHPGATTSVDSPRVAQSPADELLKYKQLLDMGAITQEEYDAKKKQLLEL